MKKWLVLLLCCCLAGSLTACSRQQSNEDTEVTISQDDGTETSEEPETGEASSKILVAYFSQTGNTAPLAEYVAEITGADIYEIVAEDPYTAEDIEYGVSDCRANLEQSDDTCRPAISGSVENMQDYDIVFIAFPIWWGKEPRIIDTFMESYDFSNITMIPFCTSGSSGITTAESNLHDFTSEQTTWLEGRRFAAGTSKETIEQWVASLGIEY